VDDSEGCMAAAAAPESLLHDSALRNLLPGHNVTLHPHGVLYTKSSEGVQSDALGCASCPTAAAALARQWAVSCQRPSAV
jgi:hypothetical protein